MEAASQRRGSGGESSVSQRKARRKPIPDLPHEDVVDLLVDYQLGRLAPSVNAAIEAHIRSCPVCKRKGLDHAVTERRVTLRKLRRVRPFRRLLSRRSRMIFLLLSLLLLVQLIAFEVLRSDSPFAALIRGSQPTATQVPTATPTPHPLTASRTFEVASAGISTLALAPDGKMLAGVQAPSTGPVVGLWDTVTGKRVDALTWPSATPPG